MSTDKGTPTDAVRTTASDPEVSSARRRLMKAALGAAPFALTLRSGAAQATISAYQCINNDRGKAKGAALDAVTTTDIWERVTVKKRAITGTRELEDNSTNPPTITVETTVEYRYMPPGTTGHYVLNTTDNKLEPKGLPVGSPPWDWGDGTGTEVEDDKVYVLMFWQPTGDDTDVYPPNYTIHPTYTVDNVTVGLDQMTPLSGSCMCSINPDFTGCHG